MKKNHKKILSNPKNLENFLDKPLMRIGFGYHGNPKLIPIQVDIGYLRYSGDSLWLLDCVSLSRVYNTPVKDLAIHEIMGNEYQFRKDLCQVPITYDSKQEHLYSFDSDSNAERVLKRLRNGSKAVFIK